MSNQVVETTSIKLDTNKCTMEQQEKPAEATAHSTLEEASKLLSHAVLSVPKQSRNEPHEKDVNVEGTRDSKSVQIESSNEKCQSELKEIFSEMTPITEDSTVTIDNKNDELGDLKMPKDVCKEGQTSEIKRETASVERDENNNDDNCIKGSKTLGMDENAEDEPENDQRDSTCPSFSEDATTLTTNMDRTASNNDLYTDILQTELVVLPGNKPTATTICPKESTDDSVTVSAVNEVVLEKPVLDDQVEVEACRTATMDLQPYQSGERGTCTSDDDTQSFNSSPIISETQEEATEEKMSPLAENKGLIQVDTDAALREFEDEDEDTTVNDYIASDHEVESSTNATALKSQENATKVNGTIEKIVFVDDRPDVEACTAEQTASFNGSEIRTLLPVHVGPKQGENHRSNANKTGKQSKKKFKALGISGRSQQCEKEKTSEEGKDLATNDVDKCPQEVEENLESMQEDNKGKLPQGDTTLVDVNTNILKDTRTSLTRTAARDVTMLDLTEPLKDDISSSEKMMTETTLSHHDAKESVGQQIPTSSNQKIGQEGQNDVQETKSYEEVTAPVLKCTPRPFGGKGKDFAYQKSFVLDAEENKEVEFKSLTSARPTTLPWKIMDKAKKFICGCLNADSRGIIYFGVGDCQEQSSKFKRGEILGLEVEGGLIDDIMKAFQSVLDDHIKSDDGPLQKGGDQNCVNLEFIPVTSEGNPTKLYVVEIEVTRDWKLCKDNVYYSKCWAEKRGVNIDKDLSTKKALSDFYKVKDEFDDVAIRTNGSSSSIKQHEVNRQVKEPLTAKYKEWKRETKTGISDPVEGSILDDSDVKRFSTLVRERLRDMNFKDFGYILIANRLPPQYRGTPHLAFLQNIPWLAVFDLFDTATKKDGLHYVCNETTDAPRAKLRSLDDFKEVSSDWISGNDFSLPTRGTTWILNNEEMQKGDWIKCSRDCFYRALSAYKLCFPAGRLLCVFLGLAENAIQEMVDMMECCFSIFGNSASSCVTVLSESKNVAEAFIRAAKPSLQKEFKECTLGGIPWTLMKENVREMVGPTKFEERGATTELPYFNGQLKEVLNKVIHSWDDLEVYSPNPRLPSLTKDIEKARNAFYKGAQASQINLFQNHCIPRTIEQETSLKIEHALKSLSKSGKDLGCHVETVTVLYEPGSGATTMCRRILWNKRHDYRCAVVKAITSATDYQIDKLQGIGYDENNINFSFPALVLVDNFPENETRRLTAEIMKRQTKCVILSTFPIGKLNNNLADFEMTSLRQLDEKETALVKDILINITTDSERRKGAEEVLEREKRFIWFGLELFGRNYDKIEKRLQNHIDSTLNFLDDSQEIHEMVLNLCCFLHYYSDGRAILPHPVASDFLYEASNETEEELTLVLMQHIHDIFGGLLVEGYNETNGYRGWRPAHSLVSEVVKSRISIEETAILLLKKVHKATAYVNKFLKEQVFKLFLDRKRISDPVFLEDLTTDDSSIDSDLESEAVGFYEVRTRYSPLIVDILEGDDGIRGALRLLITICQKATQTEGKAYAWQQLARFMGYEMRANEMDPKDDLHHRLYTTMSSEVDGKRSKPRTGIEAAHIAVDIAINQQPKYSHHYVNKGVLYLLQLRDFKPDELPNLPGSLHVVIDICRKALDVYDKALGTTNTLNLYSMIGKIQAIVSLLEIVKGLPFFRLDSESFTRYLKKSEIPREMEGALTQDEHSYVQGLSTTTLNLFNELFRDVKLRQMTSFDENATRGLNNAKLRASKLRRTFYEVTGFDRSGLSNVELPILSSPLPKDAPVYQQTVQDILFKHNETPYSSWANLRDGDVSTIYNLLRALCLRGYGSHDDLLICCKACLRLNTRPAVDELDKIVSKWVAKCPNSEWAHLFNYMIHFPIPNGSLAAFSHSAKQSIKMCDKIVREKTGIGFRKSGAEYFLGKGIGLYAIVNSQDFRRPETRGESKTEFWRSKEISEELERVCGQKDVNFKGVITYRGIQLRFDDTRYPYDSKDDLWFYIGFSVAGPYAYDPVDNDSYDIMRRKTNETVFPEIPPSEAVNPRDAYVAPVVQRKIIIQSKVGGINSTMKRGQEPDGTKVKNLDVLSSDLPGFLCSTPQIQAEKLFSSSTPSDKDLQSMTFSISTERLHHTTTPSHQASYAPGLHFEGSKREEQIAWIAKGTTRRPPSGACNDTYESSISRREVLPFEMGYSDKKRVHGVAESKVENLDLRSSEFSHFPCSNLQMQAEKSISSSMPHFLNIETNSRPDNPKTVSNATLSTSSKFLPSIKSWVSADNLHDPAASSMKITYARVLQRGSANQQMSKTSPRQQADGAYSLLPTKGRYWKPIKGTRGREEKIFQPKYFDETRKLHHGSWVRGANKSKECNIHTSRDCDIKETSRCTFAHSWRGDTLQYVCTKCTQNRESFCKEKSSHGMFIWNLGPYYKDDGTIWKDPQQ